MDLREQGSAMVGAAGALVLIALVVTRRVDRLARVGASPAIVSAVRASLWGFVALLACHAAALLLASKDEQRFYTVGAAWPLRIFSPRVVLLDLGSSVYLVLATIVVVFAVVLAVKGSLGPVILLGLSVALLVTLNATQGVSIRGSPAPSPTLRTSTRCTTTRFVFHPSPSSCDGSMRPPRSNTGAVRIPRAIRPFRCWRWQRQVWRKEA